MADSSRPHGAVPSAFSHQPSANLSARTFYLTTAIDYTNAAPHIGHAYEKILTDTLARYQRLRGRSTYFLTGVDQHGQKVQQSAAKVGMAPRAFAGEQTAKFSALYERLGISNDGWAATTDPRHIRAVQAALQQLFDAGQIYKAPYEGFYSVRAEQFLTDKERGPDGNFGPEWGEVVEFREENYYFKLREHKDWLIEYVQSHPEFITPQYRAADVLHAAQKISEDLCISRPKARLEWGIPIPFDQEFVTFVWFDALMNYATFAGWPAEVAKTADPALPDFAELWPADVQVIGKDILVPAHGIYWPIMLHALGLPDEQMPKLLVHGWWNIKGEKMSKSLGNVVDPNVLADHFGVPALRYFLMRDMATGADADFSPERLVARFNSDLANGLGNLLNRKLNMAQRYRGGVLARGGLAAEAEEIRLVRDAALTAVDRYVEAMESKLPHAALEALWGIVNAANGLVESAAPFKLAKLTDDPAAQQRLDAVLYALAESLRIVALLIAPVLPESAAAMRGFLNVEAPAAGEDVVPLCEWGGLPDGHKVNPPVPLFPRIELAKDE